MSCQAVVEKELGLTKTFRLRARKTFSSNPRFIEWWQS